MDRLSIATPPPSARFVWALNPLNKKSSLPSTMFGAVKLKAFDPATGWRPPWDRSLEDHHAAVSRSATYNSCPTAKAPTGAATVLSVASGRPRFARISLKSC